MMLSYNRIMNNAFTSPQHESSSVLSTMGNEPTPTRFSPDNFHGKAEKL